MRTMALLCCCSALTFSGTAFAQTGGENSSASARGADAGDIIVTAQKREQKLSDVGLTIVAATQEQLADSGVAQVTDLPKITPGLTVGRTYTGSPIFSMRGVNFNSAQVAAPPSVSVYTDEAPLPYAFQATASFLDIERVEVLKGPQGTLYGQNATGGSVNIILAKPTDKFSAGFLSEANNFGQIMAEGFVSGPISDTLRIRVAGTTTQGGGYQRGYFLSDRKNGDQNKSAGRILLEWQPTDRAKITLNVNGSYDRGDVLQAQHHLAKVVVPALADPRIATYPVPTNARDVDIGPGIDTGAKDWQYQTVLRGEFELTDNMTVTSITNYIHTKIFHGHDFDGMVPDTISGWQGGKIKNFTQELRLSGDIPSANLTYVAGVNYQDDKIEDQAFQTLNAYSAFPPGAVLFQDYELSNRAAGVFGNIDWEFLPDLTLTGGVRYTDTKQTIFGCNRGNSISAGFFGFLASLGDPSAAAAYQNGGCNTVSDVGPNPTFLPALSDLTQKQDNIAWRAGINYKPTSDSLIYGLISRGYKGGTFNLTAAILESLVRPISQEELTSYEVGTKLGLFDSAVRLNMSAFYYDYQDKQFFTYVPVPVIGVAATFVNIPKSTVKGFDAELIANPVEALTLRAGVTYIKTNVKDFPGFTGIGTPVIFDGEFNFAPPWTATFDAEYRLPISSGNEAYFGFGGSYASRTFADLGQSPETKLPEHVLLDARTGLEFENGLRVGAWVRNLTNKYYLTTIGNSVDSLTQYSGMPRTYGLTASYRF